MIKSFLVTDVVGSTRLWEEHPGLMRVALEMHDQILRSAITSFGGIVFKSQGDAFFATFDLPENALRAAELIQRELANQDWPEQVALRVRTVVNEGEAEIRDGDYFGAPLNRCARLLSVCHGGQILLSESVQRGIKDANLRNRVSFVGSPRLKDLSRPEPIYQLRVAGVDAEFPPLLGLDATPNNLPVQFSSFVGREQEIRALRELIRSHRLVTLTGMGGCGKTRLVLQVGAELFDRFDDGVCLISLESISDQESIVDLAAESLAQAFGDPKLTAIPPTVALKEKNVLLILDNCEHLLQPIAAFISETLKSCARVSVMATSRERLHIPGEQVWKVPPLRLEANGEEGTSEAAELFWERAQAVAPDLKRGTAANAHVRSIVSQLEGLPLLIELASARVGVVPLSDIAERLKHRIRLLSDRSGSMPLRQRTFQATMDWSYEGLSPQQQALARRLSVFVGSFDVRGLEAISAGIEQMDVVEELGSLVDKSLVVAFDSITSTRRYRLLNPVREYLKSKLESEGEEQMALNLHYNYYREFAEEGDAKILGSEQQAWKAKFADESQNLSAALSWAVSPTQRLQLACLVSRFCFFSSKLREGRSWLENGLRGYKRSDSWKARAELVIGSIALAQGDAGASQFYCESAYNSWRALGDDVGIAAAANNLALLAQSKKEYERAQSLLIEAAAAFERLGESQKRGIALTNLVGIAQETGEFDQAIAYAAEAVQLLSECGDEGTLATTMHNWWSASKAKFGRDVRPDLLAQALQHAVNSGNYSAIGLCLLGLAEACAEDQDCENSLEFFVGTERISREYDINMPELNEIGANRIYPCVRRKIGDSGIEAVKKLAVSKDLEAVILKGLQAANSRQSAKKAEN